MLASCAIPGIFSPVTLMAKGPSGERMPYVPSRQWVDGSITDATHTITLTAAAMIAFAANSVLCRLALGAGELNGGAGEIIPVDRDGRLPGRGVGR